ncbi:MAG: hypothetical protein WKF41_05535 [Gaiellaceae bacterium]
MAHQVCHDIGGWVDKTFTDPVERCVERDCSWWCLCCNKWFCFIVWIVTIVATWVVVTVCELVADILDVMVAVVVGIVNIFIGIFTWDWGRVWDALVGIVSSVVGLVWDWVRTITLGSLVGAFRDRANQWRLRNYARELIDGNRAYSPDERTRIKDALGVNGGGFGFRLRLTAYRGFVRSDQGGDDGDVRDLVAWHNDADANTRVDLRILAGFESTTFWQRGRPEIDGDFSESDVDGYLADPASASVFTIYCMSNSVFDDKLSAARVKASQVGLKLRFEKQDLQLRRAEHVRMGLSSSAMTSLLESPPFNRTRGTVDIAAAKRDLCAPITLGSFLYSDNSFNGLSAHLATHPCVDGEPFDGDDITGCTFRDRAPDFAFRYVPIHEIGHTFGLCHVGGVHRIMLSAKQNGLFDWPTIPEYWLSSGPVFTYGEAKRVWDYIVANFSAECLATRQFD